MSNAQREALERHIPTTEVIRDAVTFPRNRLGEPLDISAERFDKWLASVKADAWDEGVAAESPHGGAYLRSILIGNPYRRERI